MNPSIGQLPHKKCALGYPQHPPIPALEKGTEGCAGAVTSALPEPPSHLRARPSVAPTQRAWPSITRRTSLSSPSWPKCGCYFTSHWVGLYSRATKPKQRKSTHLRGFSHQVLQFSSHYYSDNWYKVKSEYKGSLNSLTAANCQQSTQINTYLFNFLVYE